MKYSQRCVIAAFVALAFQPSGAIAQRADADSPRLRIPFVKGYTWGWTGSRGEYRGDAPDRSMKLLRQTNTEWISLAFAAHVETASSAEILYGEKNDYMVSDAEIRHAISLARKHHFRVLLKPVVNCRSGTWRAEIDFDSEEDWDRFWGNYRAFMLHYASIAAETKCEMLCIGCEMRSMERFSARWRDLVKDIRKEYKGVLHYNANHGDVWNVTWWDAVDLIGVSAYWPVATADDTSLSTMLESWKPLRARLKQLSEKWDKPVLFSEIGVRSARTCSSMPFDWGHRELPFDGQEQARYYEAAFRTFENEGDWFAGYCWWDWKARLYSPERAEENRDFCVHGKPAEEVLRKWYSKSRQLAGDRDTKRD